MSFNWSPSNVLRLRAMHKAGCAFVEMAQAFGTTRNAVIGKSHRLGLKRRRGGEGAEPCSEPALPKPLETLDRRECHYVVNFAREGELHLYCAAPTEDTYCDTHARLMRRPCPQRALR